MTSFNVVKYTYTIMKLKYRSRNLRFIRINIDFCGFKYFYFIFKLISRMDNSLNYPFLIFMFLFVIKISITAQANIKIKASNIKLVTVNNHI